MDAAASPPADEGISLLAGARARLDALGEWRRGMARELSALPGSLERLRRGIDDLAGVVQRLNAVTAVIERAEAHLDRLGVAEAARDLDDAAGRLEEQMVQLRSMLGATPSAGARDAIEQMTRNVAEMHELGSRLFWRSMPGGVSD